MGFNEVGPSVIVIKGSGCSALLTFQRESLGYGAHSSQGGPLQGFSSLKV